MLGMLIKVRCGHAIATRTPLARGQCNVRRFDEGCVGSWRSVRYRRPASEVVSDFAYFLAHRKLEGLKIELLHGLQVATPIDLGSMSAAGTLPRPATQLASDCLCSTAWTWTLLQYRPAGWTGGSNATLSGLPRLG